MTTRKPIFTSLAIVEMEGNKKRLRMTSANYWEHNVGKLSAGKKYGVTVEENVATFSEQQRSYHFVLIELLAEHCGYTKAEMHNAVLILLWGTKTVELGGRSVQVRRSISDVAKMSKGDVSELLEFDHKLCKENEITVPTAESLGYISNQ